MLDQTTLAAVRQLLNNQQDLHIPTPPAIAKRHTDITIVEAGISKLVVTLDEIAHAMTTVITKGKDPATDPDIVRMLNARRLAELANPALEDAKLRLVEAIRTNADEFLGPWQEAFTKAGDTMRKHHPDVGPVDLKDDASEILDRGGNIATVFVAVRDADRRCELIIDTLNTLAMITNRKIAGDYRSLVMTNVDLDTWEGLELYRRHTAWELTKLGLTLDLAGPDEIRARLAAHDRTRAQRDAATADQASGRNPNLAAMYGTR